MLIQVVLCSSDERVSCNFNFLPCSNNIAQKRLSMSKKYICDISTLCSKPNIRYKASFLESKNFCNKSQITQA